MVTREHDAHDVPDASEDVRVLGHLLQDGRLQLSAYDLTQCNDRILNP